LLPNRSASSCALQKGRDVPKAIMVVESAPGEGREDEYNEWYSEKHIPQILRSPGFIRANRYRLSELPQAGTPTPKHPYVVIYHLEADDIGVAIANMRAELTRTNGLPETGLMAEDPPPVATVYELLD